MCRRGGQDTRFPGLLPPAGARPATGAGKRVNLPATVLWTCITGYDYNTVLICALNLLRREPRVEMSTSPADGCETDAKPKKPQSA